MEQICDPLFKEITPNSDIDFSDESKGNALTVKHYISWSNKKPSGPRRFQSKLDSSSSKGYDAGKKSEKEGPKCFNCEGFVHFFRECKSNRVDTSEDYDVKYKKLFVYLTRQNIDLKIFVAEMESWVVDEESSNEDKGKD